MIWNRAYFSTRLNDSKVSLGQRIDRNKYLGAREMGLACLKWIVRERRWVKTPKILQTPKSPDVHEDVEIT